MVECTEVRCQIALDAVKAQFQIDYLIIEQVNSLETFFLRETMLCEPSNWLWEVCNLPLSSSCRRCSAKQTAWFEHRSCDIATTFF